MTENEPTTETETMADISHTNPYSGETAGRLFSRGPTVVADGGERRPDDDDTRAATDATASTANGTETMADVDHTPPHDADDANRVFERGRVTHPVEDEE